MEFLVSIPHDLATEGHKLGGILDFDLLSLTDYKEYSRSQTNVNKSHSNVFHALN